MAKDITLQTIDKKVELVATGISNPSDGDTPNDKVIENIGFSEIKTSRDFEETPGNWRPIYKKTVDFGAGPDHARIDKSIDLGINTFVNLYGYAKNSNGNVIPMPFSNSTLFMGLWGTRTTISYNANDNMSSYNIYVTLEYTKTTDTLTAQPRYN